MNGRSLHGVRRAHDGDLPLVDVGVVDQARGEPLDGVAAQLCTVMERRTTNIRGMKATEDVGDDESSV